MTQPISYNSEFLPEITIAVVFSDNPQYDKLKPMFKEYGYGFMVPNKKLIIIDGEQIINNFNTDILKFIEAHEIGSAASGRNGGFMDSSLTHGIANAQQRFPDEVGLLEDLGLENLNEIEAAIKRYNIDCDFEHNGVIEIASTRHSATYLDELKDDYD